MKRKKWTPRTEITESLLKIREKRKWQIALRRYVLEQKGGLAYAPYFGLDIAQFRNWIEIQFDKGTTWANFSESWQFDHVLPVAFFDFYNEDDLKLCWNFINIRIEKLEPNKARGTRLDLIAVKHYFQTLYESTHYALAGEMIAKIETLEVSQMGNTPPLESFLKEKEDYITRISTFSAYEFAQLNEGLSIDTILEERAFHTKIHTQGE